MKMREVQTEQVNWKEQRRQKNKTIAPNIFFPNKESFLGLKKKEEDNENEGVANAVPCPLSFIAKTKVECQQSKFSS